MAANRLPAIFLAIDSELRRCDVVASRAGDGAPTGYALASVQRARLSLNVDGLGAKPTNRPASGTAIRPTRRSGGIPSSW